jgi:peptidoglycan biosynthesis protein MviN/MurJ (putative lipid II flippase)
MTKSPQKYWFKRRRYGWGWVPVTWQGWLALIIMLAAILLGSFAVDETPEGTFSSAVGVYLLMVTVVIGFFVLVAYQTSPKPKWRWGQKPDDNPDEDI